MHEGGVWENANISLQQEAQVFESDSSNNLNSYVNVSLRQEAQVFESDFSNFLNSYSYKKIML